MKTIDSRLLNKKCKFKKVWYLAHVVISQNCCHNFFINYRTGGKQLKLSSFIVQQSPKIPMSQKISSVISQNSVTSPSSVSENILTFSTPLSVQNELTPSSSSLVDIASSSPNSKSPLSCSRLTSEGQSLSSETTSATVYKGTKLDAKWIAQNNTCLRLTTAMIGGRKRNVIKCLTCEEFESEAKKFSANGTIPIASGITVHTKERLMRVVNHLSSASHNAAVEISIKSSQWKSQSSKHPWVNCLQRHRAEVIDTLLKMAIDVYNDSLIETPTAHSWPARSLAQDHALQLSKYFVNHGWDAPFISFGSSDLSSSINYHYRDPNTYREMLSVIAKLEMEKVGMELRDCLSFSIQIDGSVDRSQRDCKFVVARFMKNDASVHLKSVFLGVVEPEQNGAPGLLEALEIALDYVQAPIEKLAGICTDGEAANTGREGGLWKLLTDKVGRQLTTIWCVCHWSDLAMEAVEFAVPEMGLWKFALKSCSTFFRKSKRHAKLLKEKAGNDGKEALQFPSYFDVRFSEHTKNLINAVLSNMKWLREVWSDLQMNGDSAKERAESSGLQRTWDTNGIYLWLTSLMFDICTIFTTLQKQLQKSDLLLSDVLTCRDAALRKINLMTLQPFPGGKESQLQMPAAPIRAHWKNMSTSRSPAEIRSHIISSSLAFLQQRMSIEDSNILTATERCCTAKTVDDFMMGILVLATCLNLDHTTVSMEVCDQWPILQNVKLIDSSDHGFQLSTKIRHLLASSTGAVRRALSVAFVLSPHSMTTERVVSNYNNIKSIHRMAMSNDTINDRLAIALNGVGTANFDPRESVARFLLMKERREKKPSSEIFKQREFARKFFRENTANL
jgi:hypothetical protein